MKTIVIEGTAEQIELLKSEMDMLIIEHGKDKLPKVREDYQTANLWSTIDVTSNYNCTEEEAMDILEGALQVEATMSQIWESIAYVADENDILELKDPDINN